MQNKKWQKSGFSGRGGCGIMQVMLEELNSYTQSVTGENPWLLPLCFAMFGACIGSFLNVVIYRLPRGLSVNEPSRSFCPECKKEIPWYLNIPIGSWLMLRGRSACCNKPISPRYCLVEFITALLFAAIAWYFSLDPLPSQLLLCVWAAIMLAVLCIDWEQMIVLPVLTNSAAAAGLLAALFAPWLVEPQSLTTQDGLLWSLVGAASGYVLLKAVSLMGRLLFGRKNTAFDTPQQWQLRQAGDDIELRIGEQTYLWSELFMESANRVQLRQASISTATGAEPGTITFTADTATLADGTVIELEEHESLSGTCHGLSTRREAMGSGDALIALAIGAVCGWQGVLFALVAGSFVGIIQALIARIGRGQPMPFGPAFIVGAFIYLFFGNSLIISYLDYFGL